MGDSAAARRRWIGLLFLVVASGMLIWGETVLRPHLNGVGFLLYWFSCFVVTGLAIVTALLDMRATRRRIQEEQRELLNKTWKDLENKPEDWDRTK